MKAKKRELSGNRTLFNISVRKFIDDYVYRIDIDADYQREKIWSVKQQQLLLLQLEHLLQVLQELN